MLNPILPHASLQLKGKDILDLLHRISTVNVKSLPLNKPCPTLILNPRGKLECAFSLLKKSEEEAIISFDELTPPIHEQKILNLLDHYTFGEKYTIVKCDAPPEESTWTELQRIQSLEPQIGHEWIPNGETNPLEINLQSAIHDQKGCYPGQEIIEKIVAIGSPAKRLCLLKQSAPSTPQKLTLPFSLTDESGITEVGSLTSLASDASQNHYALGIIKRTHAKPNLTVKAGSLGAFTIEKVSS